MRFLAHAAAAILLATAAAHAQELPAEDADGDREPPTDSVEGDPSAPDGSGDPEPDGGAQPEAEPHRSVERGEGEAPATSATASAPRRPVDLREQEAWQLFQAGQLAYAAERYDNALDYFRRAHELSERSLLLVHIGRAAERVERPEEALAAYEAYLEALPEAGDRSWVEERMRALREEVVERRDAAAARRRVFGSGASAAPWVVVVASGLVAAGGGVLLGVALSDKADVEDAPDGSLYHDVEASHGRVGPFSTMGLFALSVGLAGVGAGLIWALGADDAPLEAELAAGAFRLRGAF